MYAKYTTYTLSAHRSFTFLNKWYTKHQIPDTLSLLRFYAFKKARIEKIYREKTNE